MSGKEPMELPDFNAEKLRAMLNKLKILVIYCRENHWFFFGDTRQWKWKQWHICFYFKCFYFPAVPPTNAIKDLFKRSEKWQEEKPWDQVNDNLTEDNSDIILIV